MTNPFQPPKAVVSDSISPPKSPHAILIWLAAGYWLINGAAHLLQLVPTIPVLTGLPGVMLLAVTVAAVIGVLSLWGGVMLLRRKRKATPLLLSVFSIMALWFLIRLYWVPLANTAPSAIIESVIACASMGYVWYLAKRGFLK